MPHLHESEAVGCLDCRMRHLSIQALGLFLVRATQTVGEEPRLRVFVIAGVKPKAKEKEIVCFAT